jgi:hypothetical protein
MSITSATLGIFRPRVWGRAALVLSLVPWATILALILLHPG